MTKQTIAFIGGGHMAASLIGGLIAGGYAGRNIWVADVHAEKLNQLKQQFGINVTQHNNDAVAQGEIVVLSVKPQIIHEVACEITAKIQQVKPLVISIAAGVHVKSLERWLGGQLAIVRTMPNMAALVRSSATGLYANVHVSSEQKNRAESILRSVGSAVWFQNEADLDWVTALSGSGPAYFFYVMEVLQNAAIARGLPPEVSRLLTLQTAFGATKLAIESPFEASELRKQVTSPKGTTESALNVLMDGNIQNIFEKALDAAHRRAEELGALLDQQN